MFDYHLKAGNIDRRGGGGKVTHISLHERNGTNEAKFLNRFVRDRGPEIHMTRFDRFNQTLSLQFTHN